MATGAATMGGVYPFRNPELRSSEAVLAFQDAQSTILDMPRRELSHPQQVTDWLHDWGRLLAQPASMVLIGSAALLWHAAQKGSTASLPENSMDADPVTDSEELAWLYNDAVIGSEFEQANGQHINLMPEAALNELPEG